MCGDYLHAPVRPSISQCIFGLVPVTINTLSHFHELWYSSSLTEVCRASMSL